MFVQKEWMAGGKERQRAKKEKEGRGQKEGSAGTVVTGSAFCHT